MQNILNATDRELISGRIDRIGEDDRPLWGRMSANEMLCHVTDIFRMAFGEIAVSGQSTFFTRLILSKLVLIGVPSPKGKIKTAPALDQAEGKGTKPTDVARDKAAFHQKTAEFADKDANYRFQPHPVFGPLTKQQWGRLIFLHTDYHLKQFGK